MLTYPYFAFIIPELAAGNVPADVRNTVDGIVELIRFPLPSIQLYILPAPKGVLKVPDVSLQFISYPVKVPYSPNE